MRNIWIFIVIVFIVAVVDCSPLSSSVHFQLKCSEGNACCESADVTARWEVHPAARNRLNLEIYSDINKKKNRNLELKDDETGIKGSTTISNLNAGLNHIALRDGDKVIATRSILICDTPEQQQQQFAASSSSLSSSNKSASIRFLWPLEGMVIPPTMQTLGVKVEGDLELSQEGNNLFLSIDGSTSSPYTSSKVQLPLLGMNPGSHSVVASIIDVEGEIVVENTLTFTVAAGDETYGLGIFPWRAQNLFQEPYPYYIMPNCLDPVFYEELKRTFPPDDKFGSPAQLGKRRNFRNIDPGFQEWIQENPAWQTLTNYMISRDYTSFLDKLFPEELKRKFGFIAKDYHSLSFDISVGTTDYWTPVHTDTRGRVAVFLLYFGLDSIQKGGDICVLEHKKLNTWLDYPQFPDLNDLISGQCFPPDDNFGMVFLNTPNSYHWPKKVTGTRRFLYVGINAELSTAWECGIQEWQDFKEGIKLQPTLDAFSLV